MYHIITIIVVFCFYFYCDRVCSCSKVYEKESAYTVVQKYKRNVFQRMWHAHLFKDITKRNELQCTQLFKDIRKRNELQRMWLFKDI